MKVCIDRARPCLVRIEHVELSVCPCSSPPVLRQSRRWVPRVPDCLREWCHRLGSLQVQCAVVLADSVVDGTNVFSLRELDG